MNIVSFLCKNSVIEDNFSPDGAIIFGIDDLPSTIIFQNVSFFNNSAENYLISILNTNLILENCIFIENFNNLFFLESSSVKFDQSIIQNHICTVLQYGCFADETETSDVYIINSIMNLVSSVMGGIIYTDTSNLFIEESFFSDIKANNALGSFLLSTDSHISSVNASFQNYDVNFFNLENVSLIISNNTFNNGNNIFEDIAIISYGTIYCESCQNSTINNSFFSGNGNAQTGTLTFVSETISLLNTTYLIYKCIFSYNQAMNQGGAISLFNSKVLIMDNDFIGNQANYGGSIYCQTINESNVIEIRNNTFTSNLAFSEGGAIKWIDEMPQIDQNNVFINNSALYGNDIAAFPIRMEVFLINGNETFSLSEFGILPLIVNVSSGNLFPFNISINLRDCYDQIVTHLTDSRYFFFFLQ